MKDYNEMAVSVFARRDQYAAARRTQIKRLTAVISCACLCTLLGMGAWHSGMLDRMPGEAGGADVVPGGATVPVEDSAGMEQLEQSQPAFVDGVENSDPAGALPQADDKTFCGEGTPDWAAADLTQEALYNAVGAYLPEAAPQGFVFESASLSEYGYSVIWCRGLEELHWRIRDYRDEDAQRITGVADTRNYDLALYPIPRADSVPEELREIVDDPIFRAEDLTQEAVRARAYKVDDIGDSDGYRMRFSVLYGDKVISISSIGVSPEWLFGQLHALPNG